MMKLENEIVCNESTSTPKYCSSILKNGHLESKKQVDLLINVKTIPYFWNSVGV